MDGNEISEFYKQVIVLNQLRHGKLSRKFYPRSDTVSTWGAVGFKFVIQNGATNVRV
jgi:hypothetical protein